MSIYGGSALLVIHILRNKLRLNIRTPIFIAIPYVLQYVVKIVGSSMIET
jgi:hypothetical protein